jgi:hypothetical protein
MDNNNEQILFERYPRLATVATTLGFSYNDISKYVFAIKSSKFSELLHVDPETALRALMVRLNLGRNEFEVKINELLSMPVEEQRKHVGIQQLPLVPALSEGFNT